TVIAKTGTTNLSQSAFFLGATPRYAMAVGMFVSHPGCTLPDSEQALCTDTNALAFAPPSGLQTLFGVGGFPGYGGQWPAIIWHDYFMKQFNGLPVQSWPALPANFGSAWNLVPPLPKPKPKPQQCDNGNGNPFRCRNGNQPPVICLPGSPIPCPGGGGGGVGGGGGGRGGGWHRDDRADGDDAARGGQPLAGPQAPARLGGRKAQDLRMPPGWAGF